MKRVLVFHLQEKCGLSIKQDKEDANDSVELQALSLALSKTFGQVASELIMEYVFVELDEISSRMIKSDVKADSNTV
jgi:hypothetical protein